MSTFIIAEIGSNFDGDEAIARRHIEAAAAAGVDAVKFQTLTKETLIAPEVRTETGTWVENPVWSIFGNVGLPEAWHRPLLEYAESLGIEFLSTPFYLESIDLMESIGVKRYKIASGDLTFRPLIEAVGRTGKPVILSTGGGNAQEIDQALHWLGGDSDRVTLLHCVANYPPTFDEMNLRALNTLAERFGCSVGISDHTPGDLVPIASVSLGGNVIEKHVTFDRSLPGPDHSYAMTWEEFGAMVDRVRCLETALGSGVKAPTEREKPRLHKMRRSPYDPITFRPSESADAVWLRPQTD